MAILFIVTYFCPIPDCIVESGLKVDVYRQATLMLVFLSGFFAISAWKITWFSEQFLIKKTVIYTLKDKLYFICASVWSVCLLIMGVCYLLMGAVSLLIFSGGFIVNMYSLSVVILLTLVPSLLSWLHFYYALKLLRHQYGLYRVLRENRY